MSGDDANYRAKHLAFQMIDVDPAGDGSIAERRRADPAEVGRALLCWRVGIPTERVSAGGRYWRFCARADRVNSFAAFGPRDSAPVSSQRSAQWPIAVNAGCSACPFLLSA
jgi:hypothetical protein